MNDNHDGPNSGEEGGWEEVVSDGAGEPPEVGRRVCRHGRGVDQEEEERAGGPDLEWHFKMRDLEGFDLCVCLQSMSEGNGSSEKVTRWAWARQGVREMEMECMHLEEERSANGSRTVPRASSASAFIPSRRGFTSS